MRVVPITNNAGNYRCKWDMCRTSCLHSEWSPLEPHPPTWSLGFWNVPRIVGARSCLRIFEVTVPWATHYMTCHTFFGSLFKCHFPGAYIKSIPGHSPSSALALFSVIYHRFAIIILFVICFISVCPTKMTSPWRQGLCLDHCWIQDSARHIVGAQ